MLRPVCCFPGCNNLVHVVSKKKNKYRTTCHSHHKTKKHLKDAWKLSKQCANKHGTVTGTPCLVSGEFTNPAHLDIDHIDGNPFNNDPSNHQVLCKLCHVDKTMRRRDHMRSAKEKRLTSTASNFFIGVE
jgi:hypothetical protein